MPYIPSLDILYTGTGFGFSDPMLDDRRALDLKVDFAEQGGAVVDQHAVVDSYQLDPFAAQRFADLPLATFHLDLSLRIHFQHPSSGRIFPARWLCIVAPTAGTPHTGGSLHVQRFVRPHMVVFPPVGVQPSLQMPSRKTSAVQRSLQRPVKPLDFSLRLRVPYAAPAQPNPLAHQPQRQFGSTRRRLLVPPRRAVIHQHGFWDAAAIKRHFQLLPHKLTSSSRKHNSQLARTPVGITLSHCDYPLF